MVEVITKDQLLDKAPGHLLPVPQTKLRRWMVALKKSKDPPGWFSESSANVILTIGITSAFSALTWPWGVNFFYENGLPHWRVWCLEFFFALAGGVGIGVGLWLLPATRILQKQQAEWHKFIAGDMKDFLDQYPMPETATEPEEE